MTARTMTARYRGVCSGCFGPILPGDEILHYGRKMTAHTECSTNGPVILSDASGRVVATQNRRGRCEDAPCCGCCS